MIDPDAQRGEESEASDSEGRPSRTQRPRAAAAVTRLGPDLVTLAPGDLDTLDLPERLRENSRFGANLSRGREGHRILDRSPERAPWALLVGTPGMRGAESGACFASASGFRVRWLERVESLDRDPDQPEFASCSVSPRGGWWNRSIHTMVSLRCVSGRVVDGAGAVNPGWIGHSLPAY